MALLRCGAQGVVNLGTGRSRTLTEIAAATCRAVGAPLRIVVVDAAAVGGRTREPTRDCGSGSALFPGPTSMTWFGAP